MAISTALIIIIGYAMPYESKRANRLELFNESITVTMLYVLQLFTDFIGSAEDRHRCGYIFIALVAVFTIVHIGLLVVSSLVRVKVALKRRKLLKKKEEAMKKYQESTAKKLAQSDKIEGKVR